MAVKAAQRIGRRAPLSLRTTDEIRDKLEKAASDSGRSLAQEVEFRLENSFQKDQLLEAFIGDKTHSQILIRTLATVINRAELSVDRRWVDDYLAMWLARRAIEETLNTMMGSGTLDYPPYKKEEWTPELQRKCETHAREISRETLRDYGLLMPGPNAGWLHSAIQQNVEPDQDETEPKRQKGKSNTK